MIPLKNLIRRDKLHRIFSENLTDKGKLEDRGKLENRGKLYNLLDIFHSPTDNLLERLFLLQEEFISYSDFFNYSEPSFAKSVISDYQNGKLSIRTKSIYDYIVRVYVNKNDRISYAKNATRDDIQEEISKITCRFKDRSSRIDFNNFICKNDSLKDVGALSSNKISFYSTLLNNSLSEIENSALSEIITDNTFSDTEVIVPADGVLIVNRVSTGDRIYIKTELVDGVNCLKLYRKVTPNGYSDEISHSSIVDGEIFRENITGMNLAISWTNIDDSTKILKIFEVDWDNIRKIFINFLEKLSKRTINY